MVYVHPAVYTGTSKMRHRNENHRQTCDFNGTDSPTVGKGVGEQRKNFSLPVSILSFSAFVLVLGIRTRFVYDRAAPKSLRPSRGRVQLTSRYAVSGWARQVCTTRPCGKRYGTQHKDDGEGRDRCPTVRLRSTRARSITVVGSTTNDIT